MWAASISAGLNILASTAQTVAQGIADVLAPKSSKKADEKKSEKTSTSPQCKDEVLCASLPTAKAFIDSFFPHGRVPYATLEVVPQLCHAAFDVLCDRVGSLRVEPPVRPGLRGKPVDVSSLALGAAGGVVVAKTAAAVAGIGYFIRGATTAYLTYETVSTVVEISRDGEISWAEAFRAFMACRVGAHAAETLLKTPGPAGYLLAGAQLALGHYLQVRGSRCIADVEAGEKCSIETFAISAPEAGLALVDGVAAAWMMGRSLRPSSGSAAEARPALAGSSTQPVLPPASHSGALASRTHLPTPSAPSTALAGFGAAEASPVTDLAPLVSEPLAPSTPASQALAAVEDGDKAEDIPYLDGTLSYTQSSQGAASAQPEKNVRIPALLTRPEDAGFARGPWAAIWRIVSVDEQGVFNLEPVVPLDHAPNSVRFKPFSDQKEIFRVGDEVRVTVNPPGAAGERIEDLADRLSILFAEHDKTAFWNLSKKNAVKQQILELCLQEMGFAETVIKSFLREESDILKLFTIFESKVKNKDCKELVEELKTLKEQLDSHLGARYDDFCNLGMWEYAPDNFLPSYRLTLLRTALAGGRSVTTIYLLQNALQRASDKMQKELQDYDDLGQKHIHWLWDVVESTLEGHLAQHSFRISPQIKINACKLLVFLVRSRLSPGAAQPSFQDALDDYLVKSEKDFIDKVGGYIQKQLEEEERAKAADKGQAWQKIISSHIYLVQYKGSFQSFARLLNDSQMNRLVKAFRDHYDNKSPQEVFRHPDEIFSFVQDKDLNSIKKMKALMEASVKLTHDPDKIPTAERWKYEQAQSAMVDVLDVCLEYLEGNEE